MDEWRAASASSKIAALIGVAVVDAGAWICAWAVHFLARGL